MSRRARSLSLAGICLLCAGGAVAIVNAHEADVRAQVGPLVPVVVARSDLPARKLIAPADVQTYLEPRRVPRRFAPPDALTLPAEASGLRTAVRIPAGSYVGHALLGEAASARRHVSTRAAEARVVEVPVTGSAFLREVLRPGMLVDVLVTSERGPGLGRTWVALQRVELIGMRDGGAGEASGGQGHADGVAALRVTLRQAVMLTAAHNFARELRLVPRPAGDRQRLAATVVAGSDLRP